jgi:hypothetical protein
MVTVTIINILGAINIAFYLIRNESENEESTDG